METGKGDKKGNLLTLLGPKTPGEFFYPAQDRHGHSSKLQFRAVPGLEVQIEEFISKHGEETGLTNRSAFFRAACHKLVEYFEQQFNGGKPFTNTGAVMAALVKSSRSEYELAQTRDVFDQLDKEIRALHEVGAYRRVADRLVEMQQQFNKIDMPYWRKRYLKEFEKRFGHLMEDRKSIAYADEEDE